MTDRTGFSTDFAGGLRVICYPSFRLSPALSTSVPFLKTCKFWSWLEPWCWFGTVLFLFSFCKLHLCLSPCGWSGRAQRSPGPGTNPVSPLQGNQSGSHQTKSIRSHSPKDKGMLFCDRASLLIHTYHEQAQWVRPSEPRRLLCIPAFKAWVETGDYFLVGLLLVHCIDPTCWHVNWWTLKTRAAVWTQIPRRQYRAVTATPSQLPSWMLSFSSPHLCTKIFKHMFILCLDIQ